MQIGEPRTRRHVEEHGQRLLAPTGARACGLLLFAGPARSHDDDADSRVAQRLEKLAPGVCVHTAEENDVVHKKKG
jgi:hypothetical protein